MHYDLRTDDVYIENEENSPEEPKRPRRDPHHGDTIGVRPNPIIQLNKNLLLDALATPSELAKSFGRKKGASAFKSSLKKIFVK